MKLQVNKHYKRRDGATVKIVRDNGFGMFRFDGESGMCRHTYAENGRFFSVNGSEHKFDIVSILE